MPGIMREPERSSRKTYDLIILGGGIYGCMLSLESSIRGLNSLMIERDDFGEFTSFNSLRIIHGGFRYLQDLDLKRMKESICERRFFLNMFPEFVKPLPCLMPLYGKGLRRPSVLRIGTLLYEIFSREKNDGMSEEQYIPPGKVLNTEETRAIFPSVDTEGLKGSVVWYDGFIPDSQRLLIEALRLSSINGATNLNYMEAKELLTNEDKVGGVRAEDTESGDVYDFRSSVVINSCGPWCRDLAASFDTDVPGLFRSTMAWNVLLEKKPFSDHALAVMPKRKEAQTYFLVPWKGRLLAGTGHATWTDRKKAPAPSEEDLQRFIEDLNSACKGLNARLEDIKRVFPGLQPATSEGGTKLASREVIYNHAAQGGPKGLYSISGVKFTTARLVAEKTLNAIFPEKKVQNSLLTKAGDNNGEMQSRYRMIESISEDRSDNDDMEKKIADIIAGESVVHIDDIIFRRTSLWENPANALRMASMLCKLFDWNISRQETELARLNSRLSGN